MSIEHEVKGSNTSRCGSQEIEVMTLDTALALLQRTHEAAAALLARDWMVEYMRCTTQNGYEE